MFQYLLDAFYPLQFGKKIRVSRQIVWIACSVIGFTFYPIAFIEYFLDEQKYIEDYLIYFDKHPQVISKKNYNSLDKYYICYGFLNCLY